MRDYQIHEAKTERTKERKMENSTIIVEDFNTSLVIMDKTTRQKRT